MPSDVSFKLLAVGLLATLTLLAGCGDDHRTTLPRMSGSASPTTPPGLDTTPPKAPDDQQDTPASASGFARYVALMVQHAARIRDVGPMVSLSRDQAACSTCRQLSDYIQGLERDHVWEVGPDLRIGPLRAARHGSGYRVTGRFVYPALRFVTVEGTEDSTQKDTPYVLGVDLIWDRGQAHWAVQDYTFLKEGTRR